MFNTQMTSGGILAAAVPATAGMAAGGAAAAGPSTAAGARATMERPAGQDGQALRCPRCDSSNTKFCYYNNYSLSQPRHFCKACKRYWTRGGTLRNVPVGGGCRKNKRVKKAPTTSSTSPSSSSADPSPPSMPSFPFLPNPTAINGAPSTSSDLGFLLYSLANPASDGSQLALPGLRPRLDESIALPCAPYGLLPQLGTLGLSYPTNPDEEYLPGLKAHSRLPHTVPAAAVTTPPPPLQESSLFGSTAASLLASSLKQQQHKLVQNPDPSPYAGGLHPPAAGGKFPLLKDIKMETDVASGMMCGGARNVLDWQFPSCDQNAIDDITAESSLYWNAAAPGFGGGTWPDAASCGSSVAPLI